MFSNDRDDPERFSEEFETQWQRQQFIQRVFALLTLGLVMTVVQAFVAMEM